MSGSEAQNLLFPNVCGLGKYNAFPPPYIFTEVVCQAQNRQNASEYHIIKQ